MELLRLLADPPQEFTPIPFWFLNDDLSHKEIVRQLEDFYDHGVWGVVLHPRMGLPRRVAYLSDVFFGYIRTAVETAARLGMRVVLYDEGMYPSGSAGGQVVAGHPELASQGLALAERPLPEDVVLARTPGGFLVVRKSGGTIRGLHYGQDDGEPDAPPSADILNPAAVERFIELTHEAYYRALKGYFGTVIVGFFTDEPCILGRNVQGMFPWTAGFEAVFTAAGGELAGLYGLFSGQETEDTALYHRLILEREGQVYYRRLSRWCEDHGIALMGHPHQSDDIELERYFHIPGQDLALRWVAPETGGTTGMDSTMAKCAADAARLLGRRRNSNECFGACNRDGNPWQLSGGDVKWYLDWMAVRGVNLFIPHAFYYSIAGKRREERPPDVGPHSIWWPHYRQWALYMRRLSCLMTDAEMHLPVAVPCRNRDLKSELVASLFQRQIGFQYLPQSLWGECREEGGTLWCQGMAFQAVLGEEDLFPGVPHPALDELPADLRCDPPQPLLRAASFLRAGSRCWLLVNEGESPIHAAITLPVHSRLGSYDLWNGTARRVRGTAGPQGTALPLTLARRESVLLFACTQAQWEALPEPVCRSLPPVRFTLEREEPEQIRKIYTATVTVPAEDLGGDAVLLEVQAQEMAELSVNGFFAGVGFWPPQRFDLMPFLRPGENTLRLVVTGSPANRYGRSPVWYGLEPEKGGEAL